MSQPETHDDTLAYYEAHATGFCNATVNLDFSDFQTQFVRRLSPGAVILDLGCGSGRDALAFSRQGFVVHAVDGSPEVCRVAQNLTGLPVNCMKFSDLNAVDAYDGVWACASILHLDRQKIITVLHRIHDALKDAGVLYTSFKYGRDSGLRHGRFFTDMTEESFEQLLLEVPGLGIEEMWRTWDVRENRSDEQWLNVITRKMPTQAEQIVDFMDR